MHSASSIDPKVRISRSAANPHATNSQAEWIAEHAHLLAVQQNTSNSRFQGGVIRPKPKEMSNTANLHSAPKKVQHDVYDDDHDEVLINLKRETCTGQKTRLASTAVPNSPSPLASNAGLRYTLRQHVSNWIRSPRR